MNHVIDVAVCGMHVIYVFISLCKKAAQRTVSAAAALGDVHVNIARNEMKGENALHQGSQPSTFQITDAVVLSLSNQFSNETIAFIALVLI